MTPYRGSRNRHLHLYRKEPRPGRKVGHMTVRHDDPAVVRQTVDALRELEGARRE